MAASDYHCSLRPESALLLEAAARNPWSGIEFNEPVDRSGVMRVRTSGVLLHTGDDIRISAEVVEVLPKLEVVRLVASISKGERKGSGGPPPPRYQDAGELMSAFVSRSRQILLGTRSVPVPDWATKQLNRILVDDVLILRDSSGQQAYIAADEDQPGHLIVGRNREELNGENGAVVGLRSL
jgi:hypothetical protein